MNKQQRIEAARAAMNEIDEGNPSLICRAISDEFDLTYNEVAEMYWGPLKIAYARDRRAWGDCHYCGGAATHTNFFDALVCDDCD